MRVLGADSEIGGMVTDVWVDRAEALIRYLEVEVTAEGGPKRVLLPMPFALDQPQAGTRHRPCHPGQPICRASR